MRDWVRDWAIAILDCVWVDLIWVGCCFDGVELMVGVNVYQFVRRM